VKRVIGLLLAFGAASSSMPPAAVTASNAKLAGAKASVAKKTVKSVRHAPTLDYKNLAPADEYFGPLKLSILGIRNTTSDAGKRYDFGIRDADGTMSTASFIDSAVHDWAKRYPRDQEVARALYYLQRLYAKIASPAGQNKARSEAQWMFAKYGKTPQAKELKKVLASATPPPTPAPTGGTDLSAPPATDTGAPVLVPIGSPVPGAAPTPLGPADATRLPSERLTAAPALTPAPSGGPVAAPTPAATGFPAAPAPSATLFPAPTPFPTATASAAAPASGNGYRRANPTPAVTPAAAPAPSVPLTPAVTATPALAPATELAPTAAPSAAPTPAATPLRTSASRGKKPLPSATPIEPTAAEIDATPSPAAVPGLPAPSATPSPRR